MGDRDTIHESDVAFGMPNTPYCYERAYTEERIPAETSEKRLEQQVTQITEAQGGLSIKLLSTLSGLPDRLLLMPDGRAIFVEVKSAGKRPTKLQTWWLSRIRALGFSAYVVDGKEALLSLLNELHP